MIAAQLHHCLPHYTQTIVLPNCPLSGNQESLAEYECRRHYVLSIQAARAVCVRQHCAHCDAGRPRISKGDGFIIGKCLVLQVLQFESREKC